jgi:hypothetical protein
MFFISCDSVKTKPEYLEFENYLNTDRVTETNSIYKYYFIKNAPENNEKLIEYTDNLVYKLINYKLKDSVKTITFFFFTEKNFGFFWGPIDVNYHSNSSGVEDANNP